MFCTIIVHTQAFVLPSQFSYEVKKPYCSEHAVKCICRSLLNFKQKVKSYGWSFDANQLSYL